MKIEGIIFIIVMAILVGPMVLMFSLDIFCDMMETTIPRLRKLREKNYCRNCGRIIPKGEKYCINCEEEME